MAIDVSVGTWEELASFENQDGVLEVVQRVASGKRRGTYRKFVNLDINRLQSRDAQSAISSQLLNNNVFQNETTSWLNRNPNLIQEVIQIQNLGVVLSAANLCATCVGFAVMYQKLDKMSAEISHQIGQLRQTMEKAHTTWTEMELRKVIEEYSDMLDCQKKGKPYSEDQMRNLVSQEYNVLMLLIDVVKEKISGDHRATIDTVFSFLAMYTESLKIFDELYYYNNSENLTGKRVWHNSHDRWLSVYAQLNEAWFEKYLQDYVSFETELDVRQSDIFCAKLLEQVRDLACDVKDNQDLIVAIGDRAALSAVRERVDREIRKELKQDIQIAFGDCHTPEMLNARDEALELAQAV